VEHNLTHKMALLGSAYCERISARHLCSQAICLPPQGEGEEQKLEEFHSSIYKFAMVETYQLIAAV